MNTLYRVFLVGASWLLTLPTIAGAQLAQPTPEMKAAIASKKCDGVVWQNIDFSDVVFQKNTTFTNAKITGCRMYAYKTPQTIVIPPAPAVCGDPDCIPSLPPLPMPPPDPFVLPEIPPLPAGCSTCGGSGDTVPTQPAQPATVSDFSGCDFTGADLSGSTFFDKTNLSGAQLDGANFTSAKLVGTDFSSCTLGYDIDTSKYANFKGASLGAPASDTSKTGAIFNMVDLRKVQNFKSITSLRKVNFDGSNLTGLTFPSCDASGMQARNATLDGARIGSFDNRLDYSGTNFFGSSCVGTKITNISAVGSIWAPLYVDNSTRFDTCDLSGSSFMNLQPKLNKDGNPVRDASMGCTFNNCTLNGVNFSGIAIGGLTIQGGFANGAVFDGIKAPDLDSYPWAFTGSLQLYAAIFSGDSKQKPYQSLGEKTVFGPGVDLVATRFKQIDTCKTQFQSSEFPLAFWVNSDDSMMPLSNYRSDYRNCPTASLPDSGF